MNRSIFIPRRGPEAVARRERILAEFKRSGLSAHAFARTQALPYSTLVQWLKKSRSTRTRISFAEVQLAANAPEPLILELGSHARLRICSPRHADLAAHLLQQLQKPC